MYASEAAFKKGDTVRVKQDVMCPDYKGLCIAGWQGTVTDVDKAGKGAPMVDIAWDGTTLRAIPSDYISQSEEEGLDWESMTLSAE